MAENPGEDLCYDCGVAFALAQLLWVKNAPHKVIRYVPMIISAVGCVFAENQYFASFILIPAGICLIGAVVGFLIGKKVN